MKILVTGDDKLVSKIKKLIRNMKVRVETLNDAAIITMPEEVKSAEVNAPALSPAPQELVSEGEDAATDSAFADGGDDAAQAEAPAEEAKQGKGKKKSNK